MPPAIPFISKRLFRFTYTIFWADERSEMGSALIEVDYPAEADQVISQILRDSYGERFAKIDYLRLAEVVVIRLPDPSRN